MSAQHTQPNDPERRRLLGLAVAAINVVLVGSFIGPVVAFIASPMRSKRQKSWVEVLDDSALAPGEVKEVTYSVRIKDGYHWVDRKYTVYLRRSDEGVICIDPACTHLGCRVKYQSNRHRFVCPCHGGVFEEDGKVASGPPPKPLERHQVKVEKGKIFIQREA